jgi:hypothetical protein
MTPTQRENTMASGTTLLALRLMPSVNASPAQVTAVPSLCAEGISRLAVSDGEKGISSEHRS